MSLMGRPTSSRCLARNQLKGYSFFDNDISNSSTGTSTVVPRCELNGIKFNSPVNSAFTILQIGL